MLYDQYYGLCLKIAFRYVNTYEQAVEVTHDGFLKMFRNFSRFEVRDKDKVEMLLIGWTKPVQPYLRWRNESLWYVAKLCLIRTRLYR